MLVGSHLFLLGAENSKDSIEYRKNNEFKNKVLLELINGFKFNSSLKCVSKFCILISALVKRYSEYKQTFLKNFKVRLIDKSFFVCSTPVTTHTPLRLSGSTLQAQSLLAISMLLWLQLLWLPFQFIFRDES